jgi:hypothetical protein
MAIAALTRCGGKPTALHIFSTSAAELAANTQKIASSVGTDTVMSTVADSPFSPVSSVPRLSWAKVRLNDSHCQRSALYHSAR